MYARDFFDTVMMMKLTMLMMMRKWSKSCFGYHNAGVLFDRSDSHLTNMSRMISPITGKKIFPIPQAAKDSVMDFNHLTYV